MKRSSNRTESKLSLDLLACGRRGDVLITAVSNFRYHSGNPKGSCAFVLAGISLSESPIQSNLDIKYTHTVLIHLATKTLSDANSVHHPLHHKPNQRPGMLGLSVHVRSCERIHKSYSPSAWDFARASAYTLTTSSVPLGRTKDRPSSYLRTKSSILACNMGGLVSLRSASSVLKAFRFATLTLTSRLGRSTYSESHSRPLYDLWARTTSTSNMSEMASPTV